MFWQALVLSAAIEAGAVSGGTYNYNGLTKPWSWIDSLYTSLSSTVNYGLFYLGGQMDCYFMPDTWINYYPLQMTYIFRAGIKTERLEIGYEHSCFHPIQPYVTIMEYEIKPKYEGGYNKFFVRIQTK